MDLGYGEKKTSRIYPLKALFAKKTERKQFV